MPEFFFNKGAGLRPVSLLTKRLRHKCFSVNFLKTTFLQATVSQNMYDSGRRQLSGKTLF